VGATIAFPDLNPTKPTTNHNTDLNPTSPNLNTATLTVSGELLR